MVDKQPKDINDFWMKVLSLMLAIMVWFIIKTAQSLPYTNTNPNRNQRLPSKSETKTPPPLSNPDGEEKENGSGEE